MLEDCFSRPLFVGDRHVQIQFRTRSFGLSELAVCDDYIDHLVESLQYYSAEDLLTLENLSSIVLKQHNYRLIEDSIACAIQQHSFTVVYQPIYDVKAKQVTSAEALIRISDPALGTLDPNEFIPVAEENLSILSLGRGVFDEICHFLASDGGRSLALEKMDVNLTLAELSRSSVGPGALSTIQQYGLDPKLLNMEILESAELTDNQIVKQNLELLSQHGVSFSVDDYGTGFASADHLVVLPIQYVKLDRTMLWAAINDESAMIIYKNMIKVCKDLGKRIIAEGAETKEMVDFLLEAGVDYIQGYYYSKPLEKADFVAFVKDFNIQEQKPSV